ncbi:MAG: MlaD family protein [Rhodospirillaceae bacterium]
MIHPGTRTIGLFVVGALVLGVAGLLAFGSSAYFEQRPRAVTFFHGSVAGLSLGAPVTFRGVRVGQVVDMAVRINAGNGAAHIPVIMEFEPERITVTDDGGRGSKDGLTAGVLSNGLGASLVMQSFITGQLAVELDYHPALEEFRTGIDLHVPEIPEARGGISAVKDTLAKLPIQELADDLIATLRSIRELTAAPEIKETLKNAADASRSVAALAETARVDMVTLTKNISQATDSARKAADRLDTLLQEMQPQLAAMPALLSRLLTDADHSTIQITGDLHGTLGDVHTLVTPRSAIMQDIATLLRNLAAASGSMRSFADQVDRNPNSLLVGRKH